MRKIEKKYQGVIFDLDGTLLDTIADLSDSVNEMLESYGYPLHTYKEYKLKIGNGIRNLVKQSLPAEQRSEEQVSEAFDRFTRIYDRRYLNQTRPYDGIEKLLEGLQEQGVQMGVNSNKKTEYTEALVRKLLPDIHFTGVIGEQDGYSRKPDPGAALDLAEQMGLGPDEIVYIGDSKTDMQTGVNAGMDRIGVLWGFRDREELVAHGASAVVERVGELKDFF